jgi:DNA (cytosine-5)-methyltransferase 1
MPTNAKHEAGADTQVAVSAALDSALDRAKIDFNSNSAPKCCISERLRAALDSLSDNCEKASTGFTNIVTCLSIKAARPNVDIRYHQVQIQTDTPRPAGFNFRGISENIVYPWLNSHSFAGAKSGWQTRTFERPKPYMLGYDENIGDIKEAFLAVFDEIEEHSAQASDALACLLYLQLLYRESKTISLSVPKTKDIQLIVRVFTRHFAHNYGSAKGASRLPVLALYSIYSVMMNELERFSGMTLRPLQEHSAADSQTGSVGDIEVVRSANNEVFEALEVKHGIQISERIIRDATNKIMDKTVDRYYILTTHGHCEPDDDLMRVIASVKDLYNCQMIVNGVIPSLRYYLRLLSNPSAIFPKYVELLKTDSAIAHEHREVWNQLAVMR